ncbi:MAG: hypothetical protein L6R41_005404 [Letrouitia leprolyta]|nr:MAG: hypothetical protein L6R41_005404 [Letrouitia leprolyta]
MPPPTNPHPSQNLNFYKSSTYPAPRKGKSTYKDESSQTILSTTRSDHESESIMVRKGKGQAMSYEEKEERDRVVAMLRSWEMCAVLGEEMGEHTTTRLRLQKRLIGIEEDDTADHSKDDQDLRTAHLTKISEKRRREEDERRRPPSGNDLGSGKRVPFSGSNHHGSYGHG